MPSRSIVPPAAFLILSLALTAPAAAEYPWPKPESFDVELAPLGESGVTGTAHLVLQGDRLSVILRAFGLEPGETHPVLVHGHPGGRGSDCPAAQGSSSLDPEDVRRLSGRDLLALEPAPEADLGGVVAFEHAYRVEPGAIEPLSRRTLVLYGRSGTPLACGEIRTYPGR